MTKPKHSIPINPIEKHFDDITRYHYYFFFLLFLSKLPIIWHVLNLIFLTPPMDFYCVKGTKNINGTKNICPCDNPKWDKTVFTETTQTKFSIYCDNEWLISFSQSISYTGLLLGAFVVGFLSDRYGRLILFVLCGLILAVAGCLVSVMPNFTCFIIMRFVEGVGVGGAIITSYVLCIEYCGLGYRDTVAALYHIPINIGQMTLAGISYLLRDCDQFQLAISIPVFLFVGYRWLVMESPKWLMDNGRLNEASAVMEKFCRYNKKPCENIKEEIETFHAAHSKTSQSKIKFWQIFCHKRLSLELCCIAGIYFVCGVGYYGVAQYIGKMSGDIHLNVAIAGALLLPGTIAAVFLLNVLKRRTFLIGTNLLSGLFILIVVTIPKSFSFTRVTFACICNSFFFMSFIIVFLYSVELFPTSVRNSVLGFLSVLSRIGQVIAPQLNSLPEIPAGISFAVIAVLGAVLCYPLPETKNKELPSSLEDSKNLYSKRLRLDDTTNTQKGESSTDPQVK